MKFVQNGVFVKPQEIKPNHAVEVIYDGLLSRSGAQEVYAHYGTSSFHNWHNIHDTQMHRNMDGSFSTTIKVPHGKNFNICFHDNAANWDNNSGYNYSFEIEE